VWVAGEQDRSVCVVKGKSEESCQNYIKESFSLSSNYTYLTPQGGAKFSVRSLPIYFLVVFHVFLFLAAFSPLEIIIFVF
jgi:hypothetical protein